MADSMWMGGQMYSDSVGLAQAYNTLHAWRVLYPDNYAHACYHYGRLLRQKDDPLSAMQIFLCATHAHTRDYHILGRVYNNMGDMCHIAGNYPLSYDMFKLSAEMYLRNGDSLLYYYGLNDMAIEAAKQKDTLLTRLLLDSLRKYPNFSLQLKSIEAEALLNQELKRYASVIMLIDTLQKYGYEDIFGYSMKARAYNYMNCKDSALWYAQKVVTNAPNDNASIAAYYILTHCDSTLNTDSMLVLSSARADVQKAWAYSQSKLSQAVQLLEQDLHKKPNMAWLYAIIATGILSGGLFYWRYRIRQKQLQTHVAHIIERQADTITQSIKKHIDTNNLNHTLHWKDYAAMKADADLYMGGIVTKLEEKKLNETEIRFCVLTLLDFSQSQIAQTIHYGYPSGIKTLKKRLSDKLETTPQNLKNFLLQLATNG